MSDDPIRILNDFYFASYIVNSPTTFRAKLDSLFKTSVEDIVNKTQAHMIDALTFSISAELRHLLDECQEPSKLEIPDHITKFTSLFEKQYKKTKRVPKRDRGGILSKEESNSARLKSFKALQVVCQKMGIKDFEFAKIAEYLFLNYSWSGGYGGHAWAKIASTLFKLITAKSIVDKVIWIDHAYDLQHNNCTVFDKLKYYQKSTTPYGSTSKYTWILFSLDWKKHVTDMRDYYYKVSVNLRPLVAAAAKNLQNKTIEDYVKRYTPDKSHYVYAGLWYGGVFKGTWEEGIWDDGIFRSGKWSAGDWNSGVWCAGNWYSGTWHDGTWISGTWHGGTWKNGNHKSGSWTKGIWESGNWYGGTFCGNWKDGTWYNGRWSQESNWQKGKIYSKKFDKLLKSAVPPPRFRYMEAHSKNIRQLREKIQND
jgi:hypothetical protein